MSRLTAGRLESIYRAHRKGLFTVALSITRNEDQAEDAVQEAFARLCRSRPATYGDSTAYVFSAVRNAAIDQVRRRRRAGAVRVSIFESARPISGQDAEPDDRAVEAERDRLLREGVEALPDAQREAIVMKIYGGLTFEQISEATDEPLSTVASRYRRGLRKLRESMEGLR